MSDNKTNKELPLFTVDLDADAHKWDHIIKKYKHKILRVYNNMNHIFNIKSISIALFLIKYYPWIMYKEEITSISSILDIPFEKFIAM
mgnify:CR=1 FL=1|jgi:hypothetical protein